jgi:hypothetical protein
MFLNPRQRCLGNISVKIIIAVFFIFFYFCLIPKSVSAQSKLNPASKIDISSRFLNTLQTFGQNLGFFKFFNNFNTNQNPQNNQTEQTQFDKTQNIQPDSGFHFIILPPPTPHIINQTPNSFTIFWNRTFSANNYLFQISNNPVQYSDTGNYSCLVGSNQTSNKCPNTQNIVTFPEINIWANENQIIIAGLDCGTTYYVHVKAANRLLESVWSTQNEIVKTSDCQAHPVITPAPTPTPRSGSGNTETETPIPTESPTPTPTSTFTPTPTPTPSNSPTPIPNQYSHSDTTPETFCSNRNLR